MIIGIDLGTNNVCISYYHNNKLTIIKDNQDNSFIKSLIAINNSIVITGNDVLNINDKEWIVIRNLKRLIGMSTENIIVHEKEYSIVELTSFLLSKIKKIIDQHLMSERFPLDYEIILTVPAYFNEKQRQSTKDAFILSAMKLFRIINEPTSACITYYHYNKNFDKNIMVVDIGAGTTDISILTATKDEDGLDIYEVIATSGDNLLGGEDINNILFEYFGWDKTEDNIKKIEDEIYKARLRNSHKAYPRQAYQNIRTSLYISIRDHWVLTPVELSEKDNVICDGLHRIAVAHSLYTHRPIPVIYKEYL